MKKKFIDIEIGDTVILSTGEKYKIKDKGADCLMAEDNFYISGPEFEIEDPKIQDPKILENAIRLLSLAQPQDDLDEESKVKWLQDHATLIAEYENASIRQD